MTRWIFSLASLLLALTLLAEQGMAAADSPAKTSKKPAAARGKKAAKKDAETPPKPTANDAAADAKDVKKDAKDEKKEDKKDAQPALKDAGSDSAAKPATYKVKKGPFRIEVNAGRRLRGPEHDRGGRPAAGMGAPSRSSRPSSTAAAVKRGDLILQLDTEKIDRAIADLRTELQLSELSLKAGRAAVAGPGEDGPAGHRGQRASPPDRPRRTGSSTSTWRSPWR